MRTGGHARAYGPPLPETALNRIASSEVPARAESTRVDSAEIKLFGSNL